MTEIDETLPEVVQNFLRSGRRLENITLHDDGRWTHEGALFENPKIIALFSRSVSRTPGGTWVLEIGRFTYPIVVEDTGFFIRALDLETLVAKLSDDTEETIDPASLTYQSGGRLYASVKTGAFRARFLHAPYHRLMELLEEQDDAIALTLGGHTVRLATLDDEPLT